MCKDCNCSDEKEEKDDKDCKDCGEPTDDCACGEDEKEK